MLNLAAFWRGGYALKVIKNWLTPLNPDFVFQSTSVHAVSYFHALFGSEQNGRQANGQCEGARNSPIRKQSASKAV
jgi:hypothetical protein